MPKISEIHIENYRGIKNGVVDNLGDINIFVGKNGSGKSTILETLMLGGWVSGICGEYLQAQSAAKVFPQDGMDLIKTKRNFAARGDVKLKIGAQPSIDHPAMQGKGLCDDFWFSGNSQIGPIKLDFFINTNCVTISISHIGASTGINLENPEDINAMRGIVFADSSLATAKTIEKALWPLVLKSRSKDKIIQAMNKVYGKDIENIEHSPDGTEHSPDGIFYVGLRQQNYAIVLDNLGAGIRIGFRLILLGNVMKNTALLLEEFDAYEHPESLRNLAKIIYEFSRANNIQCFMTTHRMESISAFLDIAKEYPETTGNIIGTILHEDGTLLTRSVEFGSALNLLEGGFDLRNIENYV
jgi:energy-coupling factor transporter ATP-binding protein EcfA2